MCFESESLCGTVRVPESETSKSRVDKSIVVPVLIMLSRRTCNSCQMSDVTGGDNCLDKNGWDCVYVYISFLCNDFHVFIYFIYGFICARERIEKKIYTHTHKVVFCDIALHYLMLKHSHRLHVV